MINRGEQTSHRWCPKNFRPKSFGCQNNGNQKGTTHPNSDEAKLKVKFYLPPFLPVIPVVGNYWVLYLDEGYQYALIGEPSRKYLWVCMQTSVSFTLELSKYSMHSYIYKGNKLWFILFFFPFKFPAKQLTFPLSLFSWYLLCWIFCFPVCWSADTLQADPHGWGDIQPAGSESHRRRLRCEEAPQDTTGRPSSRGWAKPHWHQRHLVDQIPLRQINKLHICLCFYVCVYNYVYVLSSTN